MASTTLRVSRKPGRCWTAPTRGSMSNLRPKRGRSAASSRWEIAPLLLRFSMRIGCIQSASGSPAFAATAPDCLLGRRSPVRLMRRDPTASYSPWALQIATSGALNTGKSLRPHPRRPAIQQKHRQREHAAPDPDRGIIGKLIANQGQRKVLTRKGDEGGDDHAHQTFADYHARGQQHAELLGGLGLGGALCPAIEVPAHDRPDDDHQRALRRQVYP